ncbi:MAG: hypothetical protein AAGD14_07580 [Planctomycetota bacterium]
MGKARWALVFALLAGCGEAEDDRFENEEEEPVVIPLPNAERLDNAALCVEAYGQALPLLLEALAGTDDAVVIDWPGGQIVRLDLERTGDGLVRFANDPERSGYSFRGEARLAAGVFIEGVVEFIDVGPCDLTLDDWDLEPGPDGVRGSVDVNRDLDTGLRGTIRFPGNGTGFFSGNYQEPRTSAIPVQFEFALE